MLWSILLMSAAVQASPLPTPGPPAYWKIRSDCAVLAAMSTGPGSPGRREGKAPTALRYAVLRQVDGCPVPTPVRPPR
jgi:hypothetical protein